MPCTHPFPSPLTPPCVFPYHCVPSTPLQYTIIEVTYPYGILQVGRKYPHGIPQGNFAGQAKFPYGIPWGYFLPPIVYHRGMRTSTMVYYRGVEGTVMVYHRGFLRGAYGIVCGYRDSSMVYYEYSIPQGNFEGAYGILQGIFGI